MPKKENGFPVARSFPFSLVVAFSSFVSSFELRASSFSGGKSRLERVRNRHWHKRVHTATESRDFLHDPRAEVGVFLARREEDGLDGRLELAIHERHLELELEIADGAQAAHDGDRLLFPREIDQQSVKIRDADVPFTGYHFLDHGDALFRAKERLLLIVESDGDDHFVEKFRRALDDIDVSLGDRIETSGVDRAAHGRGMMNSEF